jgi:ATP-dependent protease ClpP protease subunit
MRLLLSAVCLLGLLPGCSAPEPDRPGSTVPVASPEEGGAVSTAPVPLADEEGAGLAAEPEPEPEPDDPGIDWAPVDLAPGVASISCELDYASHGDGEPLPSLEREALDAALAPCAERGVLRLRYAGKINGGFTQLMRRVTLVAEELDIGKRVLDIDSSGGMVEDAIRAGDGIAESRWTIWVREGAVCHSACVFVLAAGDMRMISGRVGIHRIIRMSSTATTRAELNRELRAVYDRVRDYLERNGAATAMADIMMAVPNRKLRLLTAGELGLYGLDGINPAQDDLDRLRLMRKCGEDFVVRRDAFARAFDASCKAPGTDLETLNACGLELRRQYRFPDEVCPAESPLSEFDALLAAETPEQAAPRPREARDDGAGRGGDAGAH